MQTFREAMREKDANKEGGYNRLEQPLAPRQPPAPSSSKNTLLSDSSSSSSSSSSSYLLLPPISSFLPPATPLHPRSARSCSLLTFVGQRYH
eukprot:768062-Hanusia_phi.AAC.4